MTYVMQVLVIQQKIPFSFGIVFYFKSFSYYLTELDDLHGKVTGDGSRKAADVTPPVTLCFL